MATLQQGCDRVYSELEYGGFRDTVSALLKRFRLREERKAEAAE